MKVYYQLVTYSADGRRIHDFTMPRLRGTMALLRRFREIDQKSNTGFRTMLETVRPYGLRKFPLC